MNRVFPSFLNASSDGSLHCLWLEGASCQPPPRVAVLGITQEEPLSWPLPQLLPAGSSAALLPPPPGPPGMLAGLWLSSCPPPIQRSPASSNSRLVTTNCRSPKRSPTSNAPCLSARTPTPFSPPGPRLLVPLLRTPPHGPSLQWPGACVLDRHLPPPAFLVLARP